MIFGEDYIQKDREAAIGNGSDAPACGSKAISVREDWDGLFLSLKTSASEQNP